jgi:hypothetical protein
MPAFRRDAAPVNRGREGLAVAEPEGDGVPLGEVTVVWVGMTGRDVVVEVEIEVEVEVEVDVEVEVVSSVLVGVAVSVRVFVRVLVRVSVKVLVMVSVKVPVKVPPGPLQISPMGQQPSSVQ